MRQNCRLWNVPEVSSRMRDVTRSNISAQYDAQMAASFGPYVARTLRNATVVTIPNVAHVAFGSPSAAANACAQLSCDRSSTCSTATTRARSKRFLRPSSSSLLVAKSPQRDYRSFASRTEVISRLADALAPPVQPAGCRKRPSYSAGLMYAQAAPVGRTYADAKRHLAPPARHQTRSAPRIGVKRKPLSPSTGVRCAEALGKGLRSKDRIVKAMQGFRSEPQAGLRATQDEDAPACTQASIRWVNHASFAFIVGEVCLLADPWLTGPAFNRGWALMVPTPQGIPNFDRVTHIWISHQHPDHFSPRDLRAIPQAQRAKLHYCSSKRGIGVS